MTDIKLILNIQLFAEGDGEGGNEMQNAERKTQSVDETQSAERKAQSEMNEEVDSDGLNDGAGDNEKKEAVVEETEEGTDEEIKEGFIREREARLRNRISGWLK